VNTTLTNESFQNVVLIRVKQAQEMHAVFGDGLKAA
jgi:hypothetical protein